MCVHGSRCSADTLPYYVCCSSTCPSSNLVAARSPGLGERMQSARTVKRASRSICSCSALPKLWGVMSKARSIMPMAPWIRFSVLATTPPTFAAALDPQPGKLGNANVLHSEIVFFTASHNHNSAFAVAARGNYTGASPIATADRSDRLQNRQHTGTCHHPAGRPPAAALKRTASLAYAADGPRSAATLVL